MFSRIEDVAFTYPSAKGPMQSTWRREANFEGDKLKAVRHIQQKSVRFNTFKAGRRYLPLECSSLVLPQPLGNIGWRFSESKRLAGRVHRWSVHWFHQQFLDQAVPFSRRTNAKREKNYWNCCAVFINFSKQTLNDIEGHTVVIMLLAIVLLYPYVDIFSGQTFRLELPCKIRTLFLTK